MHKPKVSVLIPAYNYGLYLPEAIESVLNQTYMDFELIVVDNCSSDNTEEIVNIYAKNDSRILFVRNEENIGMYRNYNQALLLARGDYIKFLNADDKFEPTLLEKFVNILDNDLSISVVTSYRQLFGSKDDILVSPYKGKVDAVPALLSSLKNGNWIGEPTTVMFRRKNLNLGLFDISLLMFADFDMWLRHLRVGNLYVIDEVLSYFRIHDEQGTRELNCNDEKRLFNYFQDAEYRKNAILNNRFGYNLYVDEPLNAQKILNDATLSTINIMKQVTKNNPLYFLYSFRFLKKYLVVTLLPPKVRQIWNLIQVQRKKIKSLLSRKI